MRGKLISTILKYGLIVLLTLVMVTMVLVGFDIADAQNKLAKVLEWFKGLYKRKKMEGEKFTEADGKEAIKAVQIAYGDDMARLVEKMFRHETKHFKSTQYKLTGTPGLVKGKWPSPVPTSPTIKMKVNPALEAGGRSELEFIVWTPKECALFLAAYIKRYNGNFARWFSTNEAKQKKYAEAVNKIKAKFV